MKFEEPINFLGDDNYMDDFSLKYLGKFIFAQDINQISIRGGLLPVKTIKLDNITLLNLSE
jgi:hypothetical protein